MLNRLREGNQTMQDIVKCKERIIEANSCHFPKDVPHLFVQNSKVNDFNEKAHRAMPGTD